MARRTLLDVIARRRTQRAAAAVTVEEQWVNPVAFTIQAYRDRTRGRLSEDSIEWRAKRLHAENSFAEWDKLTELDKELWCHMARVQLLGGSLFTEYAATA